MVNRHVARLVGGILIGAACAALGSGIALAQSLVVRPLAGSLGGAGNTDGAGSAARFNNPAGIAVNSTGAVVFVADSRNHTLRRIDTGTRLATTIAGAAGTEGDDDGVGSAAGFNLPAQVATDAAGTVLFVADYWNHTIRRVDVATRAVTTLAGSPGSIGSADGVGSAALFRWPRGVATNAAGTVVFVADTENNTIRMIDVASATVTTLAGLAGSGGSTDGTGTAARFSYPYAVAADAAGTMLFVADWNNGTIRQINVATRAVTTLAGTAGTYDHVDGVGSAARFMYPSGVAVTSSGATVYVADTYSHTIRQIDVASRTVTTPVGKPRTRGSSDGVGTEATFVRPGGVAVDGTATYLYVADTENHTTRRVEIATRTVTTQAGLAPVSGGWDGIGGAASFNVPAGLAADAAGTAVYVADRGNYAVRRIEIATHAVSTLAGSSEDGGSADGIGSAARFNSPTGVAVDAAGTTVYVADFYNQTIRRIDVATKVVTTLAGLTGYTGTDDGVGSAARFWYPIGVAVNAAGTHVYVAERDNCRIRQIEAATRTVTTVAGYYCWGNGEDGVGSAAQFTYPEAVAVAPSGSVLYVADTGKHTIRRLDIATKMVTTLAGLAGQSGSADGVGSAARFNSPSGLVADATGAFLYVADSGNSTVRRVDLATGTVTTVAGVARSISGVTGIGRRVRFGRPVGIAAAGRRVFVADSGTNGIRWGAPVTGAAGDFDGDGWTDVAVYRPGSGTWFSLDSSAGNQTYRYRGWGVQAQGDTPVRGDFDGDGILDPVVFRPASGTWFILKSASDYTDWQWFGWGEATDTRVSADYDGDGITDAAVYRPSTGVWYVRPSSGAPQWQLTFGAAGDVPVAGDFDGDGKADIAVYRPASGTWFIVTSSSNFTGWYFRGWGIQAYNDTPVPGDYDGDGKTDCAVYRPGTGTWFVLKSSTNDTDWMWDGWGSATDTLVPGDYDGDGEADLAVYRPSNGTWYIKPSSAETQWSIVFGAPGDIVLPAIR